MIAAFVCGLFYGALAVWERWVRAEQDRHWQEMLDNLPPSDDDECEAVLRDWDDPLPERPWSGAFPGVKIDGIPYDVWMQQNAWGTGCNDT